MEALDGPPVPARSRRVRLPVPGRAACGILASHRGRDIQLQGTIGFVPCDITVLAGSLSGL